MNRIPIRLGPLALLLTVIAICVSSLGVLSVADAAADLRLAERYAETVRIRYELEEKGVKNINSCTIPRKNILLFKTLLLNIKDPITFFFKFLHV